MRGILLAGGRNTRLYPTTKAVSKQMLPIYDKPMFFYPLSILMLSHIRDILIISTPEHIGMFECILGDGSNLGLNLHYKIQDAPEGIPQCFTLGEDFIQNDRCCLILGDNVFYGSGLHLVLQRAALRETGSTIFAYNVRDPERFGVVNMDGKRPISLEEKPKNPTSNLAVTGLYFYDNQVVELSKSLKKSPRGEYEITDLNRLYLEQGTLNVEVFGRGTAWLDTGTPESLIEASQFIHTIEKRQGLKVACLEEIAYRQGFIHKSQLQKLIDDMKNPDYQSYLQGLIG